MTESNARPIGRRLTLALALSLVAGVLAGCISLLPKETPVQLYRFEYEPAAPVSRPVAGAPFTVRAMMSAFTLGAAGDKILTVHGDTVSYIDSGRWVAPANSLMEEAVHAAFFARGPANLFARSEIGPSDYRLTVAVPTFEARYLGEPSEPPTIVVEMTASLEKIGDVSSRREKVFSAQMRAQSNSVRSIVDAFDGAVTQVLNQLVAWTDAKGEA
ncbi:MAG: membrane integrity-associated transporter subunit PqiC [Caulobacteraceae bacterium]|nr:membrane integrity-associated transporter subunit PqiC [Caulobacteraceae bacterium]